MNNIIENMKSIINSSYAGYITHSKVVIIPSSPEYQKMAEYANNGLTYMMIESPQKPDQDMVKLVYSFLVELSGIIKDSVGKLSIGLKDKDWDMLVAKGSEMTRRFGSAPERQFLTKLYTGFLVTLQQFCLQQIMA